MALDYKDDSSALLVGNPTHQSLFISLVYPDVETLTRVKFKFALAVRHTFLSGGISMRTTSHRKTSFRMKSTYIAETLQLITFPLN